MKLKSLLIPLVSLALYLFTNQSAAQVNASSHAGVTIEACTAFPSQQKILSYTFSLTETQTDGISLASGNQTFFLKLPAAFTFSGTLSASVTGSDLTLVDAAIDTSDNTQIIITLSGTATATTDSISISGLSVVAAAANQSGSLTYKAGTATINGLTDGYVFMPIASAAAAINVTGGTLSATATYCLNETAAVLTVSGGTSSSTTSNTLAYQWQSSVNDVNFTDIGTATGAEYQPLANSLGTTYYRRKIVETSNGVSCEDFSDSISILVKTLDAGEISGDEDLCNDTVPSAIGSVRDASVAGEVITYDWEKLTAGSWVSTPSTNGPTLSFGTNTLTETTQFRRIAFSTSCTVTKSSNIITKTVFGPLDGGTLTPSTQLVYQGDTPASLTISSTSTSGNVSGTLSYQWQKSTDNINFTDISGATGNTHQPSGSVTGTLYFKLISTLTNGEVICEEESSVAEVQVYALDPGSISGNQSVCKDHIASDLTAIGSVDASLSPAMAGNPISYSWQSSADNITWSTAAGSQPTFNFTNTLNTNTYYRRIASIQSGAITATTNSILKTLLGTVVGGTMGTVSDTLCVGTAIPNLTVNSASSTGTLTYQWQYSSNGTDFNNISGKTGTDLSPTETTAGTHYYRRNTTLTTDGVACSATSSVTTIYIKSVSPGSISGEQNICSGDIPTQFLSATDANANGDTLTYQWQSATANTGPWTAVSGTNSSTTYQAAALTQTTFYRRQVSTAACTTSVTTNIIKVNVVPAVAGGTMASGSVSQTLCLGETPNLLSVAGATPSGNLTYQWQLATAGFEEDDFANIAGITTATYTPTVPTTAGTSYYRRITNLESGGSICSATSSISTLIAVGATPGAIGGAQTVCYESTGIVLNNITAANASGEIPSYSWEKSINSGANWTTIPAANQSAYTTGQLTQTTQFRRLASSPTCTVSVTTDPVILTVLPKLVAGTASGTQTVCKDATPVDLTVTGATASGGTISYQWQSSTSTASNTFKDITTDTDAYTERYTPPTNTTGTVYYKRITQLSGGAASCSIASSIVSVTVVDIIGGRVQTPTQTICYGEAPADITITGTTPVAGELYQWQESTQAPGTVSSSYRLIPGNAAGLTPSNTQTGTTYYRRITRVPGSSCVAYSEAASVIVVQLVMGTISGAETLCYGTDAASIVPATASSYSGPTQTLTHVWQQQIGSGSWTDISGATQASYDPGTLTQTTKFKRVDSIATCTATQTSNIITKTVLAQLKGGKPKSGTATQTLCLGEGTTPLEVEDDAGATNYQWQKSSSSGGTFTNISGERSDTYTPPSSAAATTFYRRVSTQSQNGVSCEAFSEEFEVQIIQIAPGTLNGAKTICYGADGGTIGSLTDASAGSKSITYSWEKSINAGGTWTTVSSQSSTTLGVGTLTQTTLYRRLAKADSCTATATTTSVEVSVIDQILGGTATGNQTLCVGAAVVDLNVGGATATNVSFQWESSPTNNDLDFSPIGGATDPEYTPLSTVSGTLYYRRLTQSTILPTIGSACVSSSSVVSVTVIDLSGGSVITPTQTICYNSPAAPLEVDMGPSGSLPSLSYQWERSSDNTNFTPLSGQDGAILSPSNTLTGTYYYRRITSTASSSCSATSTVARVRVLQLIPGEIEGAETLCYGGTASTISAPNTPARVVGGTQTIGYTWQQRIGVSGDSWDPAKGTNTDVTYNPGTLTQTTSFRRIAKINSCTLTATRNVIIKTVLAQLKGGKPKSGTATQTLCLGEAATALEVEDDAGATNYQWQKSSSSGGTFTDIPGSKLNTYTPPSGVAGTTFYRRVSTQSQGGVSCEAFSEEFEVQVIQIAPGTLNGAKTICYGADGGTIGSLTDASAGTETIYYSWDTSINAGGTWTRVATNTTSTTYAVGTLTTTSWFRRVATISSTLNCSGIADTPSVRIKVIPDVDGGSARGGNDFCTGSDPNPLTVINAIASGGIVSHQWQVSNTDVTEDFVNVTTGTGGQTQLFTPSTTTSGTLYYRRLTTVTVDGVSCTEPSSVVSVTVQDMDGGIMNIPGQEICAGSTVNTLTLTANLVDGATYEWQFARNSTVSSSFQTIPGETDPIYTPSSSLSGTTYYRRITRIPNTSCVAFSDLAGVVVVTLDPGNIKGETTICYGETASLTEDGVATTTGLTEAISYAWEQQLTDGGSWDLISGASNPNYTTAALTQTTKYKRTLYSETCTTSQTSRIITVTVLPQIEGGTFSSTAQTLCVGELPTAFTISSTTVSGTTFQWEQSPDNNLSNFTPISGTAAEGESYIPSSTNTGTTYFRRLTKLEQDGAVCTAVSDIQKLVVIGIDPGAIDGAQQLCYEEPLSQITPIGNVQAASVSPNIAGQEITYIFQSSTDNGANWNVIQTDTNPLYTFAQTLSQTTWFRRLARSADCSNTVTSTVVIKEVSSELLEGTITANQSICVGSTPQTLTVTTTTSQATVSGTLLYLWERSRTTSPDSFNPLSTGTFTSEDYVPANSATATGTTYYRRKMYIKDSSCEVYSPISAVTVVGIDAGTISATAYACEGAVTVINNQTAASTQGGSLETISYTWQRKVEGLTDWEDLKTNTSDDSYTYGTGQLTQTALYRRMALSSTCGTLSNSSNVIEIEVLPSIQAGTVSLTNGEPTTICEGDFTGNMRIIGGTNSSTFNLRYKWYQRNSPTEPYTPTGDTAIALPTRQLTQTTYFVRETYYQERPSCVVTAAELKITVPQIQAGSITGTRVICQDETNIVISSTQGATVSDGASVTYTWQQSSRPTLTDSWLPVVIGGVTQTSEDGITIPSAPTSDTIFYRRMAEISGEACPAYTDVVRIRVNRFVGSATLGFGARARKNIQLCGDQSIPPLYFTGSEFSTGVLTYKWEISQDTPSNWQDMTNTTKNLSASDIANKVNSMGGPQKDYYFRRTTISTLEGKVCEVVSDVSAALYGSENLIVNPGTINIYLSASQNDLLSQVICEGGTPATFSGTIATATLSNVVPTTTIPVTYTWLRSTDRTENYTVISGATSPSYSMTGALTQTTYFRRHVTAADPYDECYYFSDNVLEVIVPKARPIRSAGRQTLVCAGEDLTPLITDGDAIPAAERKAMSFKWFKKLPSATTFTLIPGQTAETYDPGTITQTTVFRRATTITITGSASPTCVEGPFNADYTITVNAITPGEIIYNGTLRPDSDNIIDICYGTDHAGFNSNGSVPWAAYGTPSFDWYTSPDGINYTSSGISSEDYPTGTLTESLWVKRALSSVYTFTTSTGVVTKTCTGVSSETSFTNAFKINVLPQVEKPALTSSINAQVCANQLAPGSFITISNMFSTDGDRVVYKWYESNERMIWREIMDPLNPSQIFTGQTLTLSQISQDTSYKVIASVLSNTLCTYESDVFTIEVVNIDAGTIAFTSPTAQDNFYKTCNVATPRLTITNKSGLNHNIVPSSSTFTVTWQSKPKDGSGFVDINFGTNFANTTINVLEAFNMSSSLYIRKRVAVLNDAGDVICEDYSNAVLIEYVPEPIVDILDPSVFVTDPACEGAASGSINIAPEAIIGGLTADRAQKVSLELSGTYSTTATFVVNVNNVNYNYTATGNNNSIESLTASISAALSSSALSNTLNISHAGALITLTAKSPGTPFSVTTSIVNNNGSKFQIEYIDTNALANSYSWKKFLGEIGDPLVNQDTDFTDPGTRDISGLAAGRYQLSITNNLDCTTVTVSPTFDLEDPNPIAAGTLTSSLGLLVCEGSIPLLSVPDLTLPANPIYIWQQSLDGVNWTTVKAGGVTVTAATYSVSTTLTQTTYFKRGINSNAGSGTSCAPEYSFTAPLKITVNRVTQGSIQYTGNSTDSGLVEICYNGTPEPFLNGTTPYTLSGDVSFEWYSSVDSGANWNLIPGAVAANYSAGPLTQTTQFRRRVISTLATGTATLTCSPGTQDKDYSNIFTIRVKPEIPTPTISSEVAVICASDLNRRSLRLTNNTLLDALGPIEKTWESSTNTATWNPIPNGSGGVENSNNYRLPALYEDTYFRVKVNYIASGLISQSCDIYSEPVLVRVVNINPGKIDFIDSPVVENVLNTCVSLPNDIVIRPSSEANKASVPGFEDTYTAFWQLKDTTPTGEWGTINLSGGNYVGNDRDRELTIKNTLASSIYVRRGIRQETSPGIFCVAYSNPLLINVLDAPVVNITDTASHITPPICPGDSTASITISPTLIQGGSQQAQAQQVDISLSGTYSQSGTYTPSGRYEITINSTTYSYTATASNTSIESLTASLSAAINTAPSITVAQRGNIITLTASDTATPFVISSQISSRTTDTQMVVSYRKPALEANSYFWEKLEGDTNDPDRSVTLSSTLSLVNLSAGRYRLTVTNNESCASAAPVVFTVLDKVLAPGTLTASTGNVLCVDNTGFTLTATGTSSHTNQAYIWQQSLDGNTGWTNVLSGTQSITTPSVSIGTLTQTMFYRRGMRLENAGVPCGPDYEYTPVLQMILNEVTPGTVDTYEVLVCAGDIPAEPIRETSGSNNNGTGVMTYLWQSRLDSPAAIWTTVPNATTANFSFTQPLNATTFFRRLTVNTINGVSCTSTPTGVVTVTTLTPTVINNESIRTKINNVSCHGLDNGSIIPDLTDILTDHPNPSFEWEQRGIGSFRLTTLSATNLEPGEYRLNVKTYTNTIRGVVVPVCVQQSEWFVVTEPDPFTLTLSATCDGSLIATGAGGSQNYVYTLTALNRAPQTVTVANGGSHTFLNLEQGRTYTVTITDDALRGCDPETKSIQMPVDLEIDQTQISTVDATCFGVNDGSISITEPFITGGSGRYSYEWKGPGNVTYFTKDVNNLAPGQYILTVTDATGCVDTAQVTIGSVSELDIRNERLTNQRLTCRGDNDAAIDLDIDSDPGSSLSISWFKNGTKINGATTASLSNLEAGEYKVVVTTGGSCQLEKTYTITEPDVFAVTIDGTGESPNCFDLNGGSATFNVSGGTPPYKYSLNNGAQVSFGTSTTDNISYEITAIPEGTNRVDFTDSNNCSVLTVGGIEIEVPEPIEIEYNQATDLTLIGCSNPGEIRVNVTGGTAPYSYKWDGPNLSRFTDGPLEVTQGGSYSLSVTDSKQCNSTISISVPEVAGSFTVSGTVSQEQCTIGASNASIQLVLSASIQASISWQKWSLKAAAGGTVSTTTSTCTSNCYEWAPIPDSDGKLLLTGLAAGEYRASVTDNSPDSAGCATIVRTFSVSEPLLDLFNEKLIAPSCENDTGSFSFRLKSTYNVKFFLNGNELTIATGGGIRYNNTTKQYSIPDLPGGSYLLRIVEQVPSGGSTSDGCEIFENFIIGDFEPISYIGDTNLVLNICDPNPQKFPNTSLVSGGSPFVNAAQEPYYIYRWTGLATGTPLTGSASPTTGTSTPTTSGTSSSSTSTTTANSALGFVSFLSTEAVALGEGKYNLVIEDAAGCLSDPIEFLIAANIKPISVTVNTQELSCGIDPSDGAFSIAIEGGAAPYQIQWFKETPGDSINPDPTYGAPLFPDNRLAINNLSAGRYRLNISSASLECANKEATSFTGFYTLAPSETIQILEGPFLSRSLCIGEPGTLTLKVFDRDSDSFSFYYEGEIVTGVPVGNDNYEVTIDKPVEDGILNVLNDLGCGVSVAITTGVGEPDFSYTSNNFEVSGIISANEEVTFTNTSIDLYTKMTWDFGDGSEILEVTAENEATTEIVHKYRTPGTFTVVMRFFNALGCYKETSQEIVVGRGYLVIFPSAFTPNSDGLNDIFEPKYTGIKSFVLEIFDMWGNLVYTTTVADLPVGTGWGWNGNYSTGKPYSAKAFRFNFTAITHDDKEYQTNGEAILLR